MKIQILIVNKSLESDVLAVELIRKGRCGYADKVFLIGLPIEEVEKKSLSLAELNEINQTMTKVVNVISQAHDEIE